MGVKIAELLGGFVMSRVAAALLLVVLWTGEAFALGEQMLGRITGGEVRQAREVRGVLPEGRLPDGFPDG